MTPVAVCPIHSIMQTQIKHATVLAEMRNQYAPMGKGFTPHTEVEAVGKEAFILFSPCPGRTPCSPAVLPRGEKGQ